MLDMEIAGEILNLMKPLGWLWSPNRIFGSIVVIKVKWKSGFTLLWVAFALFYTVTFSANYFKLVTDNHFTSLLDF